MVQRKASQYLLRAEQIYHDHLDMSHNTTTSIPGAIDIPADQVSGISGCKGKAIQGCYYYFVTFVFR